MIVRLRSVGEELLFAAPWAAGFFALVIVVGVVAWSLFKGLFERGRVLVQ